MYPGHSTPPRFAQRALNRLIAIGAAVAVLSAAFAQPLVILHYHELDDSVLVVDPLATAARSFTVRIGVAAVTERNFPDHEALGHYVRFLVNSRVGDPNHFSFQRYDVTASAARALLRYIDAVDEVQASLRAHEDADPNNAASALAQIPIHNSSDSTRDGTVERFLIRPDSLIVPFSGSLLLATGHMPEAERTAEERRALDELGELIRAALEYLDTTD